MNTEGSKKNDNSNEEELSSSENKKHLSQAEMINLELVKLVLPKIKLYKDITSKLRLPQVDLEGIKALNARVPQIRVPQINLPRAKAIEMKVPQIEIPQMYLTGMKAFEMKLPKIELPKFYLNIAPLMNSINWKQLSESLKRKLEKCESLMISLEQEGWAVDVDLLDDLIDGNCIFNEIEDYLRRNLSDYIEFFEQNEIYSKHLKLILRTKELYDLQFYEHCTFALFAIFEEILNVSFSEYKLNNHDNKKRKSRDPNIYQKAKDYIETKEDETALCQIFFRRVYGIYQVFFKPSWKEHPDQLNRNWIMHGSYDYERINEVDVLKLFQLLKAVNVVSDIDLGVIIIDDVENSN